MAKNGIISAKGEVVESFGNERFGVRLDNGVIVSAYLGGKLRRNHIRILPGDTVVLEFSPYDLKLGRIARRI